MNALLPYFFCTITLFSAQANAHVRVAFFEIMSPSGRPVILEPGGRFAHVAITFREGWLHSHPVRGVEVISENALRRLGRPTVIELPWIADLTEDRIADFIGKPYDPTYTWSQGESYYCSEVVGKILDLKPTPMNFAGAAWSPQFSKLRQNLGLSPDDIFQMLIQISKNHPLNCSALSGRSP